MRMYRMYVRTATALLVLSAGTTAGARSDVAISGYIKSSFTYLRSDAKDESETNVSKARVKFSGKITEKTSYTVLVDVVRKDILLDAYINRTITPSLSAMIGQFKTPFGTDNNISSARLAFLYRPYMQSEMSPAFRDKGVMLTYSRSCIDVMAGLMNGSGQNVRDTNTNKSVACRIVLKINPLVNISGNYYTGKDSVNVGNEYIDAGINGSYGSWEYDAEIIRKDRGAVTGSSCFVWISRDVTTGNEGIGTVTPAVRIERSDTDTDIEGNAKSRYTFSVTAHMARKYVDSIMLNYEMRDPEKGAADNLFGIQYTVIF